MGWGEGVWSLELSCEGVGGDIVCIRVDYLLIIPLPVLRWWVVLMLQKTPYDDFRKHPVWISRRVWFSRDDLSSP